jgi:hypothetical protein
VSVPNGGTGTASWNAYAVVIGGTNATNPLQQAPTGTTGMPLISAGPSASPGFGPYAPPVIPLVDAATILVDASLGNVYTVTLGGSRTMGTPSNATRNGQFILFRIQQPASAGPDTISWAGGYSFGAGSAPTLSTANNAVDEVAFRYDATLTKWLFQGSQLGFS